MANWQKSGRMFSISVDLGWNHDEVWALLKVSPMQFSTGINGNHCQSSMGITPSTFFQGIATLKFRERFPSHGKLGSLPVS